MKNDRLKTVVIGNDTYVIEKFDARSGLKVARLLASKLASVLPLISQETVGEDNDAPVELMMKALESVSDADIDAILDKCLAVCSKSFPAGPQPVLHADGTYGVPEAQYDIMLAVKLCIEAVKWGASDFFGESSPALEEAAQPTLWQKLKGTTNSSTPR